MLQGITFDFDGTLAQTFERQHKWFKYWAKINKKELKFNEYNDFNDFNDFNEFKDFYNTYCTPEKGVQNVYDKLGLPCNMNDKSHPVWDAYEAFKEKNPVIFYDGVKDAVKNIWKNGHLSKDYNRNRRLRMSINTTNSWKSIYNDLKREDMIQYFDCFVTEEVLRSYHGSHNSSAIHKPSKISLALTLGLIDCEGEFVMHVGDTINDLAASQKVIRLNPMRPETLITVGTSWGYEGRDKLEKGVEVESIGTVHFNYIIDKPSQLIEIVDSLI